MGMTDIARMLSVYDFNTLHRYMMIAEVIFSGYCIIERSIIVRNCEPWSPLRALESSCVLMTSRHAVILGARLARILHDVDMVLSMIMRWILHGIYVVLSMLMRCFSILVNLIIIHEKLLKFTYFFRTTEEKVVEVEEENKYNTAGTDTTTAAVNNNN